MSGMGGIGVLYYHEEGSPYKLWIPQSSDFVKNSNWLWKNFPPDSRFHSVIVEADDVLTPKVMRKVLCVYKKCLLW